VLILSIDVTASNVFLNLSFRIASLQICGASFLPFTNYRAPGTSSSHSSYILWNIRFIFRSFFSAAVPMIARSKAWVCGRLLSVIAGSNPVRGMDV
jgi:hypothetical protein